MQRPGHKINTREADPNPYITFIRPLKNKADHEVAEQILKAVAAQMKKIMEQRFMLIGTLEEAEYNRVFAGRNWNYGQTVELVLRRANGHFLPLPYILSVMCHEMAHITHMNHGAEFQKLNNAIKKDVAAFQAKGYYGDGFWSDGKRLSDGAKLGAEGINPNDLPSYVCGVTRSDAQKARSGGSRPRSSRAPGLVKGEASLRSGRQTDYRRKAGRRNNANMGESSGRLDGRREITKDDRERRQEWIDRRVSELMVAGVEEKKAKRRAADQFRKANPWYREGSTFGKQAKSKSAAELRAAAAERRLAATVLPKKEEGEEEYDSNVELVSEEGDDVKPDLDDDGSDDEVVLIDDPHLTAEERGKELEAEMSDAEREALRSDVHDFLIPDFDVGRSSAGPSYRKGKSPQRNVTTPIYVVDDSDEDEPSPKRRATGKPSAVASKAAASKGQPRPAPSTAFGSLRSDSSSRASSSGAGGNANLIRQERLRALGMAPTTLSGTARSTGAASSPTVVKLEDGGDGWECRRCHLHNPVGRTRCEVCQALPSGEGAVG